MPTLAVLFLCGCVIALLVLVASFSRHLESRKSQRYAMLQQALSHPQLDAETRNQILRVLAKEHSGGWVRFLFTIAFWERLIFAAGWLMLLLFGGRWAGAQMGFFSYFQMDFMLIMALLGLAMMSLPIAMHEFIRRTRSVAVEQ